MLGSLLFNAGWQNQQLRPGEVSEEEMKRRQAAYLQMVGSLGPGRTTGEGLANLGKGIAAGVMNWRLGNMRNAALSALRERMGQSGGGGFPAAPVTADAPDYTGPRPTAFGPTLEDDRGNAFREQREGSLDNAAGTGSSTTPFFTGPFSGQRPAVANQEPNQLGTPEAPQPMINSPYDDPAVREGQQTVASNGFVQYPELAGQTAAVGGGNAAWAGLNPVMKPIEQYRSGSLTGDVAKWADATHSIESAGTKDPYRARGPVMKSGQYKGERAIGRYQVMPGNVAAWTRDALGYAMSPQEFLMSDEAQDAVFAHRFGGYVKKYGSPAEAAHAWFTGGPSWTHGKRSDGYMQSNVYMNKFDRAMARIEGEGYNPEKYQTPEGGLAGTPTGGNAPTPTSRQSVLADMLTGYERRTDGGMLSGGDQQSIAEAFSEVDDFSGNVEGTEGQQDRVSDTEGPASKEAMDWITFINKQNGGPGLQTLVELFKAHQDGSNPLPDAAIKPLRDRIYELEPSARPPETLPTPKARPDRPDQFIGPEFLGPESPGATTAGVADAGFDVPAPAPAPAPETPKEKKDRQEQEAVETEVEVKPEETAGTDKKGGVFKKFLENNPEAKGSSQLANLIATAAAGGSTGLSGLDQDTALAIRDTNMMPGGQVNQVAMQTPQGNFPEAPTQVAGSAGPVPTPPGGGQYIYDDQGLRVEPGSAAGGQAAMAGPSAGVPAPGYEQRIGPEVTASLDPRVIPFQPAVVPPPGAVTGSGTPIDGGGVDAYRQTGLQVGGLSNAQLEGGQAPGIRQPANQNVVGNMLVAQAQNRASGQELARYNQLSRWVTDGAFHLLPKGEQAMIMQELGHLQSRLFPKPMSQYEQAQIDLKRAEFLNTIQQQGFTDDIREYEYMEQQAAELGLDKESFRKWFRTNKKIEAGGYGDKLADAMIDNDVKAVEDMFAAARNAEQQMELYSALEYALSDPNVDTGIGGDLKLDIEKVALRLGVGSQAYLDTLGKKELIRSVSNRMALLMRNPDSGMGMPGAVSNRDIEFLKQAQIGLGNTKAGNMMLLKMFKSMEQRKIKAAYATRKWLGDENNRAKGIWSQEYADFMEQELGSKSVFESAEFDNIRRETADGKIEYIGPNAAEKHMTEGTQMPGNWKQTPRAWYLMSEEERQEWLGTWQ